MLTVTPNTKKTLVSTFKQHTNSSKATITALAVLHCLSLRSIKREVMVDGAAPVLQASDDITYAESPQIRQVPQPLHCNLRVVTASTHHHHISNTFAFLLQQT